MTFDARFDLAHLAHTELLTPDPEGSLWFFRDLLGLEETGREGQSVYLRACEDPYHHSLKLTEAKEAGLGHAAWRASSQAGLERRAAALERVGLGRGYNSGDVGHGPGYEFQTSEGHRLELIWDVEKFVAPEGERSVIKSRRSRKPLRGVPVRRIDHLNLMARSPQTVQDGLAQALGFGVREIIVDEDDELLATWMTINNLSHELAVMSDQTGAEGRLHHVCYLYGVPQHNVDAAEMFREHGVRIEAGPDRHGITNASFLYVFEPGGNRVELFGDAGFLQLEPDYEPIIWTLQDEAYNAIGGMVLPTETFYLYGTPSPVPIPPTGPATVQ